MFRCSAFRFLPCFFPWFLGFRVKGLRFRVLLFWNARMIDNFPASKKAEESADEDLDYSKLLEAGISPVTVTWDSGNLPGFCDSQPQTHMVLSSFNFSSYLHHFFVFFSIFQNMRFPFSLLKRRKLCGKPADFVRWSCISQMYILYRCI